MNFTQAKLYLANLGIVLVKKDDEYKVSIKGEKCGYYTNDLNDAIQTGQLMNPEFREEASKIRI